jgi:archaemetzincin
MTGLDVVPIYLSDRARLVEKLGAALGEIFQQRIRIRTPWFDPETTYDSSRGQYNSSSMLRLLLGESNPEAGKILGVTSVDLFTPILTYVFGEAQLDGRAAVVSIHRLQPEAYGLPADEMLLFDRLEKEAVHELGHTYGLIHCPEPSCVMRASRYVEEIDLKMAPFCRVCLETIRGHNGHDRSAD